MGFNVSKYEVLDFKQLEPAEKRAATKLFIDALFGQRPLSFPKRVFLKIAIACASFSNFSGMVLVERNGSVRTPLSVVEHDPRTRQITGIGSVRGVGQNKAVIDSLGRTAGEELLLHVFAHNRLVLGHPDVYGANFLPPGRRLLRRLQEKGIVRVSASASPEVFSAARIPRFRLEPTRPVKRDDLRAEPAWMEYHGARW